MHGKPSVAAIRSHVVAMRPRACFGTGTWWRAKSSFRYTLFVHLRIESGSSMTTRPSRPRAPRELVRVVIDVRRVADEQRVESRRRSMSSRPMISARMPIAAPTATRTSERRRVRRRVRRIRVVQDGERRPRSAGAVRAPGECSAAARARSSRRSAGTSRGVRKGDRRELPAFGRCARTSRSAAARAGGRTARGPSVVPSPWSTPEPGLDLEAARRPPRAARPASPASGAAGPCTSSMVLTVGIGSWPRASASSDT